MKKFLYWFLGDRAGRTVVAVWNWLWGLPVESGGKVAVEVASESLTSMQESVLKLTQAVSSVTGAYRRAKELYEVKYREFQQAERQAVLAQQQSNAEAARLAMTKAILIEKSLPQMAERVAQAEQSMIAHQGKLQRERQKLESYKVQMQNLKALAEVNEALAEIARVNTELSTESARNQFEAAQAAIERRHVQVNALAELAENPTEKLETELNRLTLDDEVTRRLQRMQQTPHP
jgi:phage shock protein A